PGGTLAHRDRRDRHRVNRLFALPEAALRLLGEVDLAARRDGLLLAHDAEEEHRAGRLHGLELVEPRERDRVLERAPTVEALEHRPYVGPHLGERALALERRLEHVRK